MKSLEKSLSLLNLFLNPNQQELSITELSKMSGLDKASVKRMCSTFVEFGFLKQQEKRGKYSLGIKFLDFGGFIKKMNPIRDVAMPHLIRLSRKAKESVVLSILDGQFAAYNQIIPSDNIYNLVPDERATVPLYCTCVGKIFLANMSDQELQYYFDTTKLEQFTDKTIIYPELLKAHLAIIRKEGIAYNNEEMAVGLRSVAAGVKGNEGKTVAAVGVIGNPIRFNVPHKDIIALLNECVSNISRDLGYKPPLS